MQSQIAYLHRAAGDTQPQRALPRAESQNIYVSRAGAVARSSLRNQHSSAQINSKACRCEVFGSDHSSAEDLEPRTEEFLTRLGQDSFEPLGDRLLSVAQDVAKQIKAGASLQGNSSGKRKREETGYSSDPRVALLYRVRQFENIQLNSKECICSIIDSEIQQMYELTKYKNAELRAYLLELTEKASKLKNELDTLRRKQRTPYAYIVELMNEDERFRTFLNRFPEGYFYQLAEYLAQLESDANATNAPNYYKLEYAKLKAENAELVDSSNEMASAVGLLYTQIGSLEEQISGLQAQLADADAARGKYVRLTAQGDENLRKQCLEAYSLLYQRDADLKSEHQATLDLQQRCIEMAYDIARNKPFYEKITHAHPDSSLLRCIQRPETMIDDIVKAFEDFYHKVYNTAEKATGTEQLERKADGRRDVATSVTRDLLDAQYMAEYHFARWLCLQTIAMVYNFAQQRLQFRELARRQDERLRLLGNTVESICKLLAELA